MKRSDATQQEKYIAFKTAHGTIKTYLNADNFIGAYVIAFSLIEDRIRAMSVVRYRSVHGEEPKPDEIVKTSFSKLVKRLTSAGDISSELSTRLQLEANNRNSMLHAAMWNMPAFTKDAVERAVGLVRELEKLRREVKLKYGSQVKTNTTISQDLRKKIR